MKIRILSDLHLEGHPFTLKPGTEDVMVLAGDIGRFDDKRLSQFMEKVASNAVYVYGNHEAYRGKVTDWDTERFPQCLNMRSRVIDGVKLIGTPLWTDFRLYDSPAVSKLCAVTNITDFRLISGATPEEYIRRFNASVDYIKAELACSLPCVVVTHWGCSGQSISKKYARSPLNPYFHSDCTSLFRDNLKLWIHGHTHESVDYTIGKTRVVANPCGYHDGNRIENTSFSSTLTVEI